MEDDAAIVESVVNKNGIKLGDNGEENTLDLLTRVAAVDGMGLNKEQCSIQ